MEAGFSSSRAPSAEQTRKVTGSRALRFEEDKAQISQFLSSVKAFSNAKVPAGRILDAMVAYEDFKVGFRVVELFKGQNLFQQGHRVQPGVFFVYSGAISLKREYVMELKLKPRPDDDGTMNHADDFSRTVEVALCRPGDALGNETMLSMAEYNDTARAATTTAVLVFVPADLFDPSGKFAEATEFLVRDLKLWQDSRNLKFERVRAMFHSEDPFAQGFVFSNLISTAPKGPPRGFAARSKNTVTVSADSQKRYFHGKSSHMVFAGSRGFVPGEVPYVQVQPLDKDPRLSLRFVDVGPPRRIRKIVNPQPPKCVLPESRVTDLYRRLWKDCSKETLTLLVDLQSAISDSDANIVTERDVESAPSELATPRTLSRDVPSRHSASRIVPRIDVGRLQSIASAAPMSDRPSTAPNRTRSQLTDRDTGPLLFLKRPMTTRGHRSTSKYLPRMPI